MRAWLTRLVPFSGTIGGLLLTVAVWQLFILNPSPLQRLDLLASDLRFRVRGLKSPGPEVVIAAIDEKSIDQLGRWPWPYTVQARLVDRLSQYGAAVIGYDVVFSSTDTSAGIENLLAIKAKLENSAGGNNSELMAFVERAIAEADHDRIFADALKRSDRTVLGYFFHFSRLDVAHLGESETVASLGALMRCRYSKYDDVIMSTGVRLQTRALPSAWAVESSIPVLSEVASGCGFINSAPDLDGVHRRYQLMVKYRNEQDYLFVPLGIRVLEHYLRRGKQRAMTNFRIGPEGVVWAGLQNRRNTLVIPTDRKGQMLINHLGPSTPGPLFPRYSIVDIIEGRRDAAPPEAFRDKMVLVGATAVALVDLRVTPFDPSFPGVELHATVIDNILRRDFLAEPRTSGIYTGAAVLLLGAILAILLPRLGGLWGSLTTLLLLLGIVTLNYVLFATLGLWLSVVYPLLVTVVVWTGMMILYNLEIDKFYLLGMYGTNLFTLPVSEIPRVDRRLRRLRLLSALLHTLDIEQAHWDALLQASRETAQPFANILGARLSKPVHLTHGLELYPCQLPVLPLRIETRTALLILSDAAPPNLVTPLRNAIMEHQLSSSYLLLIDRTAAQDAAARLVDTFLKVTVITEHDLTGIILSSHPQEALCRIIARTADFGDISPYQISGGVDNPALFFGRRYEIALLAGREARNHLLIGARQIGKSSILKSLQRQYPDRVYFVTLTGDDLGADFKRAGLPPLETLVRDASGDKTLLFLFDEADLLVAADRQQDYPLCRYLRALSEEGHCRFVLAGFWELHHAAYLEHQSPIRNFLEPIPLGPLEGPAAHALATQPLEPLGIRFASDDLVSELLHRTGCRPNLIARACDAALRMLPPLAERVITAEILHAVLDVSDASGRNMAQAFADLGALTNDPRACALDRLVMYATVGSETFSLSDVRARLEAAGVRTSAQELRDSLERLTLAYVIKRQAGNYVYPVPLVRDFLLAEAAGDPESMLAIEARDWCEV